MERVVLPTRDAFPSVSVLAWVDDIVIAAPDHATLANATVFAADRIMSFGGRLSLAKCHFFVQKFDWCGVEIDLATSTWRIAPGRVASLLDRPIPKDRKALQSILGSIRYYYFGVADQDAIRACVAKLVELDVHGAQVARLWTDAHTAALRRAFSLIASGDWALIFDPTRPVYVTTDASSEHGFAVTAHQFDADGRFRPISFHSQGWKSDQMLWTAQLKEAYAARFAIVDIMWK